MGIIQLTGLGRLGESENTLNEYDNEISDELLDHRLRQIAAILENMGSSACYVLGMGAHRNATYSAFQQ